MGAELEPHKIFSATLEYAQMQGSNLAFVFYATPDICALLQKEQKVDERSFIACQEVISMEEKPLASIKKKDATTTRCLLDHAQGVTDACLTCANTGAVVAVASLYQNYLFKINRPCLATSVPTRSGYCILVDVGARISATAKELTEFAYLATSFAKNYFGIEMPRVGLLNIGREFVKGGDDEKEAYKALEALSQRTDAPYFFCKNVEPYDVFSGDVDIVVTNGFCGNILLKSMEATASFVISEMQKSGVSEQVVAILQKRFSQDVGIGGHLLGLNGYIAKCHGKPTAQSIQNTLAALEKLLKNDFVGKTEAFLQRYL